MSASAPPGWDEPMTEQRFAAVTHVVPGYGSHVRDSSAREG
ncbi:hypothetical protein SAMN05216259_104304 [Actinacidiphila guanduensis]|uniref:Uncharacterized protein n=1 Tax=Actinacidiphila guanduensis TaxID=310781 RepID=A0A1H0BU04_9ACTN|nr:hypothetical protein SAMN05216259_104304 [Actinacidiphila guanduensis]